MLSVVPFQTDGMIYIILFGEPQYSSRWALEDMKTTTPAIFLHVSEMTAAELAQVFPRGIAHLGFGTGHHFVRDTPDGPRSVFLPSPWDGNYLLTIINAIAAQLLLDAQGKQKAHASPSVALGALIRFVSGDGLEAQDQTLAQQNNHNNLVQHLSVRQQTYVESLLSLHAARSKRLSSDSATSNHQSPILGFIDPCQLVEWLDQDPDDLADWFDQWTTDCEIEAGSAADMQVV
ncbi:hypothetical protein BST61_g9164 [Cercospora zeina]